MEINLIDSSFLVALFYVDDSQHQKALEMREVLRQAKEFPDFIVAETATVLKNRADKTVAENFLKVIKEMEGVSIKSYFDMFEIFSNEFINEENDDLSFVDASLLALHKTGKYKVVTFDKKLLKLMQGKKVLKGKKGK